MKWVIIILLVIGFVSIVDASCEDGQIDINSAFLEELILIKWVGPAIAQNIIDARPFDSVDDLIDVNRIGDIILEKIKVQELACVSDNSKEVDEEEIVEEAEEVEEVETIEENVKEVILRVSGNLVKVEEKSKEIEVKL